MTLGQAEKPSLREHPLFIGLEEEMSGFRNNSVCHYPAFFYFDTARKKKKILILKWIRRKLGQINPHLPILIKPAETKLLGMKSRMKSLFKAL